MALRSNQKSVPVLVAGMALEEHQVPIDRAGGTRFFIRWQLLLRGPLSSNTSAAAG